MYTLKNIFYDWFGLNEDLFLVINHAHTALLDQCMLFITWLGHPQLFPIYIVFLLLLSWYKPDITFRRNITVFAVSYFLVSVIIIPLIKSTLNMPRPYFILGEQLVNIVGCPDTIQSFPSGHAAFAVLTAASLALDMPRILKITLVLLAVLVCVSRVYVGAHFPADVLGGALLSLLTVFAVRLMICNFHPPSR